MEQKQVKPLTETNFKQIPEFLRGFHHWVNWILVEREGKLTKVPVDPRTGEYAKTNDKSTWGTFEQAKKKYLECTDGSIQGIGFVLTGSPLTVIDQDHCRNPGTREIKSSALGIANDFRSYTEISPSDTGLHTIIIGKLPKGVSGCRKEGFEIYSEGRYITITGNILPDGYVEINDRQKTLTEFYREHFPKETITPTVKETLSPSLPDTEVIKRVLAGNDGEQFKQLWDGDITAYGSDWSKADFAFNCILARVTQDKDQIDRLLRKSHLMREKWDSKRGGSTYGAITINKAILEGSKKLTHSTTIIDEPIETKAKVEDTESYKKLYTQDFITWSDLKMIESVKPQYLWEDILISDGMSLLVAKPRVGKTTFALNLAHSIALGISFLQKETRKGKVLYLMLEESIRQMQETTINWEHPGENILFRFGIASIKPIEDLEKWITEYKPDLVIIDTLQKFLRVKDLNDYAEVTVTLQPVMDLARKFNCHILMTHHAKKADTTLEDSILGSIGLQGGVDTTIHLKKYELYRTFSTIQRYGDDIPETTIEKGDHSKLTLGMDRKDAEVHLVSQMIYQVLRDGPKGMKDIVEATERRKGVCLEAIRQMSEKGQVHRDGTGKRNNPYTYSRSDI